MHKMMTAFDFFMVVFMILSVVGAAAIFSVLLGKDVVELAIAISMVYAVITFVGYLRAYNGEHYES